MLNPTWKRRTLPTLALLLLGWQSPFAAKETARVWHFEAGPALPKDLAPASGAWAVAKGEGAPSAPWVLAQTATNPEAAFNVALIGGATYRDLDVSVHLRARHGKVDQGGGLVWRAKDGRNYYIARYNPLEDNLRVYTVTDGRRRQLASAEVRLDRAAWHVLRVQMSGDHITCALDGRALLSLHDPTFAEPGRIGLWTKADAQTWFDDLTAKRR